MTFSVQSKNPAFILSSFLFKRFFHSTEKKEALFNYSVVTVKLNQPSPSWEHDEGLGETEIVVQDPISLLPVSGVLTEEVDKRRKGDRESRRKKKERKEKIRAGKKYWLDASINVRVESPCILWHKRSFGLHILLIKNSLISKSM